MLPEVAQLIAMMNASNAFMASRQYGNPYLQNLKNQRQKRKLARQTGRYKK